MAADVSMDFDVVSSMADMFQGSAESLGAVDHALEVAIAMLKSSAFVGVVGNLALAGYLENIRPNVGRLAATCGEMSDDLRGAILALRDGDFSGSQRFVDGGGAGGGSGMGGAPTAAPGSGKVGTGKAVKLSDYQDGVNGWQLISMNDKFTPNELLVQKGPSCTIYGAMNLLVENGYNISQADADKIYSQTLKNPRGPFIVPLDNVWVDMLDGKHDSEGFNVLRAELILSDYDVDYDHDDFSSWLGLGSPDRSAGEKFLVNQVTAGNPVYVTTKINETFGLGSGGHAYTVVGSQTDSSGKLTSVLVSTNWGSERNAYEIPAQEFMDDWMNYHDGEYIVIEH